MALMSYGIANGYGNYDGFGGVCLSSGNQSPTSLSRTIEKVFDDCQYTGQISLCGRKLKTYPRCSSKYDLIDTSVADLSKNHFTEVPEDVCYYCSLERLNLYHNLVRCLPPAISNLQSLVELNLSHNLLSVLPPYLCQLTQLQVLLLNENRLVSLPEEIGLLSRLTALDVSCNEITHLPNQLGDLSSLKSLNVRRNILIELPISLSRLKLRRLDFSSNRIAHIPCDFRKVNTLEELHLDNNPLVSPPLQLCSKGLVHVMKYLCKEADKDERKRGIMQNDGSFRRNRLKRSSSFSASSDDRCRWNNFREKPKPVTFDSGYNTMDSVVDKTRWSELNVDACSTSSLHDYCERMNSELTLLTSDLSPASPDQSKLFSKGLDTRSSNQRLENWLNGFNQNVKDDRPGIRSNGVDLKPPDANRISESLDAISKELQRQKAEYEARKKKAEMLKMKLEETKNCDTGRSSRNLQDVNSKPQAEKGSSERGCSERGNSERGNSERGNSERGNPERGNSERGNPERGNSERGNSERGNPERGNSERNSTVQSKLNIPQVVQRTSTPSVYRRTQSDIECRTTNPSTNISGSSRTNGISKQLQNQREAFLSNHCPAQPAKSRLLVNNNIHCRSISTPVPANNTLPRCNSSKEAYEAYFESKFYQQQEEVILRNQQSLNVYRKAPEGVAQKYDGVVQKSDSAALKSKSLGNTNNQLHPSHGNVATEENCFSFSNDSTPNASFTESPFAAANNHQSDSIIVQSKDSTSLVNGNASLTQKERNQIEQMKTIIQSRLKITLPDDVESALKDGVILCHLANHFRPRSVACIHVPSPATVQSEPKLSLAKCKRNFENFLLACRRIGLDQDDICPPSAILDDHGIASIASTILALVHRSTEPQHTAV